MEGAADVRGVAGPAGHRRCGDRGARTSPIDPIPDALPQLPDYASASGVTFIGPVPGAAEITSDGDVITVQNRALSATFNVSDVPQIVSFENRVTGTQQAVPQGNLLWSANSNVDLSTLAWTRLKAPQVTDWPPRPTPRGSQLPRQARLQPSPTVARAGH